MGKSELHRTRPEVALPEEARHYLELAYRSSELSRGRITPSRFIAWAEGVGLAFHPDWHRATDQAASEASRSGALEADRRREQLICRWARSSYWSLEEGAVLAYDLDPNEAIMRSVPGYDGPRLRAPADARQLVNLAQRAIEVGALEERAAPIAFMKWARSMGVEFHPDWWAAVAGEEALAKDEAEAPPPAAPVLDLKTKEQETLLKMVAAMAMAYYGWDRDALRNTATGEIADDLEKVGVSLDPDTIRKWLRTAAELIPGLDA